MIELYPEYKIGETVYYALPGEGAGLVTDITYRLSSNIIWYHVTFNPQVGEMPYRDFELSREKHII